MECLRFLSSLEGREAFTQDSSFCKSVSVSHRCWISLRDGGSIKGSLIRSGRHISGVMRDTLLITISGVLGLYQKFCGLVYLALLGSDWYRSAPQRRRYLEKGCQTVQPPLEGQSTKEGSLGRYASQKTAQEKGRPLPEPPFKVSFNAPESSSFGISQAMA